MLAAWLILPHRSAVGLNDSGVGRAHAGDSPRAQHIHGLWFYAVFPDLAWLARGALGAGAVNDPVMLHHGDHHEEDEEF